MKSLFARHAALVVAGRLIRGFLRPIRSYRDKSLASMLDQAKPRFLAVIAHTEVRLRHVEAETRA